MATYHVALRGEVGPSCRTVAEADVIVPWDEVMAADGRHFTCVECHRVLTGGRTHAMPVEAEEEQP
jgi:hypothetical protein